MVFTTPTSPHVHAPDSVTRVMVRVLIALAPGVIAYVWYFGWGVVVNMALAVVVALGAETLMLLARQRPLGPFLTDGSALVTACLLALALPPLAPWWITAIGVSFAIVVAKHLYGGLGYNPFNPAMVGYVMLLISFPREMTTWIPPQVAGADTLTLIETTRYVFTDVLPGRLEIDALTMASPLDTLKTQLALGNTVSEVKLQFGLDVSISEVLSISPIFGALGGKGWEWINGGFLIGGLWLIYRRVISWHIPVAMIATLSAMAAIFYAVNPEAYASPIFHLFSGATMLGAFFIATDPVTAATTPIGKLIYGAGIGVLLYVIRAWGGYPDAVAFAVLLLNTAAPMIDYYTQPRVFGHPRK